jgi:hypothetical protein
VRKYVQGKYLLTILPRQGQKIKQQPYKMSNAIVCVEIKRDVVMTTYSEDSDDSESCEGCPWRGPTAATTTKDNKQRARGEQDAYFSPVINRTRIGNKRVRGKENKPLSAAIKRTRITQTNGKKRFQEQASFASK